MRCLPIIRKLSSESMKLLHYLLGIRSQGEESNRLARLAGGWTKEEHELFETAVAATEQIDEELWL